MLAPEASTVSSVESFVKESNSQKGNLNKNEFFSTKSQDFLYVNHLANKTTSKTVVEGMVSSLDTQKRIKDSALSDSQINSCLKI